MAEGGPDLSSDTTDPAELPNDITMRQIGAIHIKWARLDWLATVGLINLLNLQEAEAAVLLGPLDVVAKIRKAQRILHIRGEQDRAATLGLAAKEIETSKEVRNAITHGLYQGTDNVTGDMLFVLMPSLIETEQGHLNELFLVGSEDLTSHLQTLEKCIILIAGGFPSMTRLGFAARSRVRAYAKASKNQAKPAPKHPNPPRSSLP